MINGVESVPEPSPQPLPKPCTIDDEIDRINEQLEGIRNEIAGICTEIRKLNQRGGVNQKEITAVAFFLGCKP